MHLRYLLHLLINKYQYPKSVRWKVVIRRCLLRNKAVICSDGSCFSIAADGDIEGLCKNKKGHLSGSDIIQQAVAQGGTKCNSFGPTLYNFYCRNGFKPVSWCRFDWRYAPRGTTHAEPLVFFMYTEQNTTIPYDVFLKQQPAADFIQAYQARDAALQKKQAESPLPTRTIPSTSFNKKKKCFF